MDNEPNNIQPQGEPAPSSDPSGGETPTIIDAANAAAERMEKANEIMAKNLARQEKILAEARVQGRGIINQPEPPKELTPQEYADKVMRGEIGYSD